MKNLKTLGRALGIAAFALILAGSISGCGLSCLDGESFSWYPYGCFPDNPG
ncbi:MAG: hypothetical protein ACR2PJ_00650 [Pseudomonadales bacterium]